MCEDVSPPSWTISSARSVSIASMPALRERLVQADLVGRERLDLHDLVAPGRRDELADDPVRLGRVAGPVDGPAALLHARLELEQVARRGCAAPRPSSAAPAAAQRLPVGQLGDDARRASRGSCRSRARGSARSCASAKPDARRPSGTSSRCRRRRREDLGEVERPGAAPSRASPPPMCMQARVVGRRADLGAGVARCSGSCRRASPPRRRRS